MHQSVRLYMFALTFCLLSLPLTTMADNERGRIMKINGEVHVINKDGQTRKVEDSKFVVHELDTIVTEGGGKAVVQFNDGSLSVLDEKSKLRVEKSNWLSHIGGKIYFTFRKIFGPPRKVSSHFATIGVRGTTFIVYGDEGGKGGIALQEGKLEVESPGEAYELHIKRELDEFEAYKQQALEKREAMKKEFEDYKKQVNKEFVEYRKSISLEANRVLQFDGNRVDETSLDAGDNQHLKAEFASFEQEAGELLEQFRQQSKEHRESADQPAADSKPAEDN